VSPTRTYKNSCTHAQHVTEPGLATDTASFIDDAARKTTTPETTAAGSATSLIQNRLRLLNYRPAIYFDMSPPSVGFNRHKQLVVVTNVTALIFYFHISLFTFNVSYQINKLVNIY